MRSGNVRNEQKTSGPPRKLRFPGVEATKMAGFLLGNTMFSVMESTKPEWSYKWQWQLKKCRAWFIMFTLLALRFVLRSYNHPI